MMAEDYGGEYRVESIVPIPPPGSKPMYGSDSKSSQAHGTAWYRIDCALCGLLRAGDGYNPRSCGCVCEESGKKQKGLVKRSCNHKPSISPFSSTFPGHTDRSPLSPEDGPRNKASRRLKRSDLHPVHHNTRKRKIRCPCNLLSL